MNSAELASMICKFYDGTSHPTIFVFCLLTALVQIFFNHRQMFLTILIVALPVPGLLGKLLITMNMVEVLPMHTQETVQTSLKNIRDAVTLLDPAKGSAIKICFFPQEWLSIIFWVGG